MGRGISPLQRYILTEAGKRSRVYYADVLEGFFKWKPKYRLRRYQAGETTGGGCGVPLKGVPAEDVGTLRSPNSQHFSRADIGEKVYRKTTASLSRAVGRLRSRGLVTCLGGLNWAGVAITDAGRQWLSVN